MYFLNLSLEEKMKKLGEIPKQFLNKAVRIIDLFLKGVRHGWKKLSGLKNEFYSFRLSMNYRLLTDGRTFFVGSHDAYENKIKNLKRFGH